MCIKEFVGYKCGHCSTPKAWLCPLTAIDTTYPPCAIPAERCHPSLDDCPGCARAMWNSQVLVVEEAHREAHLKKQCQCGTIFFPGKNPPRRQEPHRSGGEGSQPWAEQLQNSQGMGRVKDGKKPASEHSAPKPAIPDFESASRTQSRMGSASGSALRTHSRMGTGTETPRKPHVGIDSTSHPYSSGGKLRKRSRWSQTHNAPKDSKEELQDKEAESRHRRQTMTGQEWSYGQRYCDNLEAFGQGPQPEWSPNHADQYLGHVKDNGKYPTTPNE